MVSSIRLSDENHIALLKIQGEMQAKSGKTTTMDHVIAKLIEPYTKNKKR